MTLVRLFNWFLLEIGSESYTTFLYPLEPIGSLTIGC